MATFKIVVVKEDKKIDNTWNVKIRVTHKRRMGYIGTDFYVTKKSFNKKGEIINSGVLNSIGLTVTR
jgi:hypothetical protein